MDAESPFLDELLEDMDWRNAVHMEIQENAKLPTFHWNVDRSNSVQPDSPTGQDAESFLSRRANRHQQQPLDSVESLLVDVNPTPLSEIRQRSHPLPIPSSPVEVAAAIAATETAAPASPPSIPQAIQSASQQKSQYAAFPKTAAYERKKQRAKDARVRLNESIERLQIAMQLAGTQSEKRARQWTTDDAMGRAFGDCATTAQEAKKWDRPSFVGTAATIIEQLNAQCELLVEELQQSRKRPRLDSFETHPVSIEENKEMVVMEPAECNTADATSMWSQEGILPVVFSFLDPLSLSRSRQVCKRWASQPDQEHWNRLALLRFGAYNVRQWDDAPPNLYRAMDEANVRPHVPWRYLGDGRLASQVSAWTYLVERSNGETLRAVAQPQKGFVSLPVVELRTVVQNTGLTELVLKEQSPVVDASTRRRGEEFAAVEGDDRLVRRVMTLDGEPAKSQPGELCRLRLFDSVVLQTFVLAKGCSTTSKFLQRANFTQVLVSLESGVTKSLVITFKHDEAHA